MQASIHGVALNVMRFAVVVVTIPLFLCRHTDTGQRPVPAARFDHGPCLLFFSAVNLFAVLAPIQMTKSPMSPVPSGALQQQHVTGPSEEARALSSIAVCLNQVSQDSMACLQVVFIDYVFEFAAFGHR